MSERHPFMAFTADGLMLLRWTLPDGTAIEYYPEVGGDAVVISPSGGIDEVPFSWASDRVRCALLPEDEEAQ